MAEVVKSGAHSNLAASSQQGAVIEPSILPNAPPCTESALGSYKDVAQILSGEHITFETPSIFQGELPNSI